MADTLPTPSTTPPVLPPRPAGLHKGQAGHVAVLAGSRGMSGAAALAGLGALRGGAGLVRVHCPASILPLVAGVDPCLMTVPLGEDDTGGIAGAAAIDALDFGWATVVAAGPGLGQHGALAAAMRELLRKCGKPLILDADGLNNLATLPDDVWALRSGRPTLVTPHPGEMNRLRRGVGLPEFDGSVEDGPRLRCAHEFAVRTGVTVLLKGHRTVVCKSDRAFVNTTGNPGMATGGMGDVLTGLIAALVAQGLDVFEAACLGAYVHGLSADHCARQIGAVGYLAREVADGIPAALAESGRPKIGYR